MLSIGHLIIDPIANIALQTLPEGSEWYSTMEMMQYVFPAIIDIIIIILIVCAIVGIFIKK